MALPFHAAGSRQHSRNRCEKIKLSPEQDQGVFWPVMKNPEVSRRSLLHTESSGESYFGLQSISDRLDTPASTVDPLSYAYLGNWVLIYVPTPPQLCTLF